MLFPRIITIVLLVLVTPQAYSVSLPDGFSAELISDELNPVAMAEAPDGRLFVAEKNGRVLVIRHGKLLPRPFLTLDVDDVNERGISGIVFDPAFEENQYLYVYYTVKGKQHNRISRFTAYGDTVLPGSEHILMDLDLLKTTAHNGGAMRFAPDGSLIVAVGNGGVDETSQDMDSLSGKILRIHADGSIPPDNPFYNHAHGSRKAIYALGLRNPFSMDIDKETGRIIANDVGGYIAEEVNIIKPGMNYGWPLVEGERTDEEVPDNYRDPLYFYPRSDGCAIVGAAYYQPQNFQFPQRYHGKYFFSDYCNGYIKVLNPSSGEVEEQLASELSRPVALEVGNDGSLYFLERQGLQDGSIADNSRTANGRLWRITYQADGASAPDPEAIEEKASGSHPTPRIISPKEGLLYRGEVKLLLEGEAHDEEDGVLPPSSFHWAIDIQHGGSPYRRFKSFQGARSAEFPVPTIADIKHPVSYRVALTVTDSDGLSRTVERKIPGKKATMTLESNLPGMTALADGYEITIPATINGIENTDTYIEMPKIVDIDNHRYSFKGWESEFFPNEHEQLRNIDKRVVSARYEPYKEGTGTGVTADYYRYKDGEITGPVLYSELVDTINFEWGMGSPEPGKVGDSLFAAKIRGGLEVPFSGQYTFYSRSDDGVRLRIADQLIIDRWDNQSATEWTGSIYLEQGTRYPLELDYFEDRGGAWLTLMWSSEGLEKQLIPRARLYPRATKESSSQ